MSVQQADLQKVKDAVSSAVDVMQAMGSSICPLLSKVSSFTNIYLIAPAHREMIFYFILVFLLKLFFCFVLLLNKFKLLECFFMLQKLKFMFLRRWPMFYILGFVQLLF